MKKRAAKSVLENRIRIQMDYVKRDFFLRKTQMTVFNRCKCSLLDIASSVP